MNQFRILDSNSLRRHRKVDGNNVDVRGLEAELKSFVEGEVRFDAGKPRRLFHGFFQLSPGANRGCGSQKRRGRGADGQSLA